MSDSVSYGQYVFLTITGWVVASISIFGSSLIIISIFHRARDEIKTNTLYQVLLGLSISDILSSLAVFLGPIMLIEGFFEDRPWAIGNQATCTANASMWIFGLTAGSCYNCFMSIHFFRTIRTSQKQQRDKKSDRCQQVTYHSISIAVALIFVAAGIAVNGFQPHALFGACWYNYYPVGCEDNPEVECEQTIAKNISRIRIVVVFITVVVSVYCTVALSRKVQASLRKSEKYAMRSSSMSMDSRSSFFGTSSQAFKSTDMGFSSTAINTTGVTADPSQASSFRSSDALSTDTSMHERPEKMQQRQSFLKKRPSQNEGRDTSRRREVAIQARWYLVAYLNTVILPFVSLLVVNTTDAVHNMGSPGSMALFFLLLVTQTSQGALNFAVFIRPRYNAWRAYFEKEIELTSADEFQDDAALSRLPPFYTILWKAVLENVPTASQKRRKPRRFQLQQQSANTDDDRPISVARVSFAPETSAVSDAMETSKQFSEHTEASKPTMLSNTEEEVAEDTEPCGASAPPDPCTDEDSSSDEEVMVGVCQDAETGSASSSASVEISERPLSSTVDLSCTSSEEQVRDDLNGGASQNNSMQPSFRADSRGRYHSLPKDGLGNDREAKAITSTALEMTAKELSVPASSVMAGSGEDEDDRSHPKGGRGAGSDPEYVAAADHDVEALGMLQVGKVTDREDVSAGDDGGPSSPDA